MKRYLNGAIGRARHLRREMTLPEQALWKALRKPDLGARAAIAAKAAEALPARFLRSPKLILTQPSPREGEGLESGEGS